MQLPYRWKHIIGFILLVISISGCSEGPIGGVPNPTNTLIKATATHIITTADEDVYSGQITENPTCQSTIAPHSLRIHWNSTQVHHDHDNFYTYVQITIFIEDYTGGKRMYVISTSDMQFSEFVYIPVASNLPKVFVNTDGASGNLDAHLINASNHSVAVCKGVRWQ